MLSATRDRLRYIEFDSQGGAFEKEAENGYNFGEMDKTAPFAMSGFETLEPEIRRILSGLDDADVIARIWRRERIKSLAPGGSVFEGDLCGDDV